MKKNNNPVYLETTKSELIKLLEFVCKNKGKKVFPSQIKNELFPNLDIEEIYTLIYSIKYRHIQPISLTISNGDPRTSHIQYRTGLEEFVKSLRKMNKREKLHRIVEFLSIQNETNRRSSLNSEEISKAFSPELSIYEINSLCNIIIDNGDVKDCTSKDESMKRMKAVLIINATHDAYHTKKYLEEDNEINTPINQNIVNGDNVIIGNNYGSIKQVDNSVSTEKSSDKPKWLKWVGWILAVLLTIFTITELIQKLFFD